MPNPPLDLGGQRFGRLVAISKAYRSEKKRMWFWNCICDCGSSIIVRASRLAAGTTKSCGCLRKDTKVALRHGHAGNGQSTPEYQAWISMRKRCYLATDRHFADYGARGIIVCKRWSRFEEFLEDMGLRPSAEHSLDRRDNDGNYEPGNCRWATREEQANNKRSNRLVFMNEERLTFAQAARKYGLVSRRTASQRVYRGLSDEDALLTPIGLR